MLRLLQAGAYARTLIKVDNPGVWTRRRSAGAEMMRLCAFLAFFLTAALRLTCTPPSDSAIGPHSVSSMLAVPLAR